MNYQSLTKPSRNKFVEVNGNDFDRTCDEIERAGSRIESWDASVGGKPAQWRINYFEGGPRAGSLGCAARSQTPKTGSNPVPSTIFERVPELAPPSPSGKALTGEHCQQVNNPAALTQSSHQAKIPARLLATVAVKSEVAPRDPFKMAAKSLVISQPVGLKPSGAETVGVETSIQDRMARLQSLARASGKLKPNKPRATHARQPYVD